MLKEHFLTISCHSLLHEPAHTKTTQHLLELQFGQIRVCFEILNAFRSPHTLLELTFIQSEFVRNVIGSNQHLFEMIFGCIRVCYYWHLSNHVLFKMPLGQIKVYIKYLLDKTTFVGIDNYSNYNLLDLSLCQNIVCLNCHLDNSTFVGIGI